MNFWCLKVHGNNPWEAESQKRTPHFFPFPDIYEYLLQDLHRKAAKSPFPLLPFLEEFSASEGTLVGFCVMGGIFSEGIDLMGEKLIGAIIIGTGLPQIGTESQYQCSVLFSYPVPEASQLFFHSI